MKKVTLLLGWCLTLALGNLYAQENQDEKKRDFLKNYKAPDFKMHRLDLSLNLAGSYNSIGVEQSAFNERTNLRYRLYANSQKYQGFLNVAVNSEIAINKNGSKITSSSNSNIYGSTENYFFLKNKWFIGAHGLLSSSVRTNSNAPSEALGLTFLPAVSIGKGRLEPVLYARNAMDIERSLSKGGRLSKSLSTGELKQLSDKIAEINNVRFYDFRLRRIEQFEALDELFGEMDLITEKDIRYFTHVADVYLYAKNFQRFSGFRQELGVTQGVELETQSGGIEKVDYQYHRSYSFYKLRYELPQSYAVQHSFQLFGIGGYENVHPPFDAPVENRAVAWLGGNYLFGLYPTTRTHFSFGASGAYVFDEKNAGFRANFLFVGDVYFSPRFRLRFESTGSLGNSNQLGSYNYLVPLANGNNGFSIQSNIRLSYAIF